MDYSYEYENWLNDQKKRAEKRNAKPFVGQRNLHFDGKISLKDIEAGSHYITNTLQDGDLLAKHKYLPFIRNDRREREYKYKPYSSHLPHEERYPTVKNRKLMYASHKDACIYSFYNYSIGRKYEKMLASSGIEDNVTAYRSIPRSHTDYRGKSNIELSTEAFGFLKGSRPLAVLTMDIEHFFDNLEHEFLKEAWLHVVGRNSLLNDEATLLKTLTDFRYVIKDEVFKSLGFQKKGNGAWRLPQKTMQRGIICTPSEFSEHIKKEGLIRKNKSGKGIPQGSPVSGLLANIYLIKFDIYMANLVEGHNNGLYRRYSDDILIIASPEKIADLYKSAADMIGRQKLRLKQSKTECFLWNPEGQGFLNITDRVDEHAKNTAKTQPSYLGMQYSGNSNPYIKSSTIIRRFRGADKLKPEKWAYYGRAMKVTGSVQIKKQYDKARKKIKKSQRKDDGSQ